MWYKKCQISVQNINPSKINDFTERNHLNQQIRDLEELVDKLIYSGEIAKYAQREAKKIAYDVLTNKKISSFPDVITSLNQAIAKVLDNPHEFMVRCLHAADQLTDKIYRLHKMRDDFAYGGKDVGKVKKGLF